MSFIPATVRHWIARAIFLSLAALALQAQTPTGYSPDINLDLTRIPFSRYGSYLAFSHLVNGPMGDGLYLRSVHGFVDRDMLRVEVTKNGSVVPFHEEAHPTLLRLNTNDGSYVEICVSDPNIIRLRGHGVDLRLTKIPSAEGFAFQHTSTRWEFNAWQQDIRFMLTSLQGTVHAETDWNKTESRKVQLDLSPATGSSEFETAMEEFRGTWHARNYAESFNDAEIRVRREYQQWLARMPAVPVEFQPAANLAAYQNWSAIVAPEGELKRSAMLMSKNWMNSVWTWDPCFNAMALIARDPQTAWDQFMVMFDDQTSDGDLPDQLNDRGSTWAFNKPPIHGWALAWMMRHSSSIDLQRLDQAYEPLARWTEWYFQFRDDDHDGLPEYDHGNDTGWDNSTVFRDGPYAETPDLASFLVIQMETLSEVARRLAKDAESQQWQRRADGLLKKLVSAYWKNGHFIALRPGDHSTIQSDSLLLYLPIVLGKQLPPEVRAAMIADLKREGDFLTANGLATERLQSSYYQSKGYWRGPIWAPSTMIIADGLDAAGEKEFARELKLRFCRMAARSGFSENYDAVSGRAQDDPAYTWTSSVFLIFAHELLP